MIRLSDFQEDASPPYLLVVNIGIGNGVGIDDDVAVGLGLED